MKPSVVKKKKEAKQRIGVVGLGYVGLTLGLTFADIGFPVRAVDISSRVRGLIASRKAPFFENGLPELLVKHVGKHFIVRERFTAEDVCDVYFITVGTPLEESVKGKETPRLDYIEQAARDVGSVLKRGDTVILRSTVPLGITRNVVAPVLEQKSGLKAGTDFYLAFGPERTIEGKALEELRTLPQVIGGINRESARAAEKIFKALTPSTVIVDGLEEAEIVKLMNNTYRDVTFGLANEFALICERWGLDTNSVITASNFGYARGGVPRPSPGVGGYCLEKDPFILAYGAKQKGYTPRIVLEARATNERILASVADRTIAFLNSQKGTQKNKKIFIVGFAFKGKPATSDLRGSTTVACLRLLQKAGYTNIQGFDAVIPGDELSSLGVKPTKIRDGFMDADAVLVMNNHDANQKLNIRTLTKTMKKGALLFDTWALYDRDALAKQGHIVLKRL